MKKYLVFGVAALLLLAGVIYFLWQQQGVGGPVSEQVEISLENYTNTKYGITFQYPASWILNDAAHSQRIVSVSNPSQFVKPETDGRRDSVSVLSNYVDCEFAKDAVVIAGKSATEASWHPVMGGQERIVCFSDGMAISLLAREEDSKPVLENMLSTFRFTE